MDGAATGPVGPAAANEVAIGDSQSGITAGPRGPLLVHDWQLFEQHAHFNRERIPERVVCAKGSGAYGTLTITNDITRYSRARRLRGSGRADHVLLPILHGGRRARRLRWRARRARLRHEVLHRRGHLGPGRQRHPCVLRSRPLQVPGLPPHPEARPAHQHAQHRRNVGLLFTVAGDACTRSRSCSRTAAGRSHTGT